MKEKDELNSPRALSFSFFFKRNEYKLIHIQVVLITGMPPLSSTLAENICIYMQCVLCNPGVPDGDVDIADINGFAQVCFKVFFLISRFEKNTCD